MAAAVIPLIVITGPTASGKTAVALRLAQKYSGEIVCADSRTVYRGLDIGTAKPTAAEQALVPHHVLDVADPNETYNLSRFQADARLAITAIRARGRVPFLVGGSGLYIDSVVLDYKLGARPNMALRHDLDALTLDQLLRYSSEHNIYLQDNYHNKRYIVRAIEQGGINTQRRQKPDGSTHVIAITTQNNTLKNRIHERAQAMFDGTILHEVRHAIELYSEEIAPLQAPAYKAARRLIRGSITKDEAINQLAHDDWQLARKQLTWLRRNPWTVWKELDEVELYVDSILAHNLPLPAE